MSYRLDHQGYRLTGDPMLDELGLIYDGDVINCPTCDGSGWIEDDGEDTQVSDEGFVCPTCDGSGVVPAGGPRP